MSRPRRPIRAFTLLELLLAIAVSMLILAVLGKLLLDGIYLQRLAWERTTRSAVSGALIQRLRADALGAAAHTCEERTSGLTLDLLTCIDGQPQQVRWVFERDDVLRRADGCDAGSFCAERLQFAAHVEPQARGDLLVLDLTVSPPARARHRPPLTFSQYVLLPQPMPVPVNTGREQQP
jgi:type II secretory pathway pseudopilin PulG